MKRKAVLVISAAILLSVLCACGRTGDGMVGPSATARPVVSTRVSQMPRQTQRISSNDTGTGVANGSVNNDAGTNSSAMSKNQ